MTSDATASSPHATSAAGPIHIVGVTQRSGTNFLRDLLALHPDTVVPPEIHEDYFPDGAGALLAGIDQIVRRYPEAWTGGGTEPRAALTRHVGSALQDFLRAGGPADGRLLTKTPGAVGLSSLVQLLADTSLLVLVRDGRDVTASGMRGLGWSFEEGLNRWLQGAREILSVLGEASSDGPRVHLIRYEELVGDLRSELSAVLQFTGLDAATYPWGEAESLPLSGSSFVRGDQVQVHWQPVERPEDFRPVGRAEAWPALRHARFALRAGEELRAFGYDVPQVSRRTAWLARLREAV